MGINDVTVTLGSETLHFTEADRIGALMYRSCIMNASIH